MKNIIYLTLFSLSILHLFSQDQNMEGKVVDSLLSKSYEVLELSFIQNIKDSQKSSLYAHAMLEKARLAKDSLNILKGYTLLSYINDNNKSVIKYADQMISIAQVLKHDRYLCISYLNKANYYFYKRKFQEALDNYLKAKEFSSKFSRLNYLIIQNIGVLKSRLGEDTEALKIFKDNWKFVRQENYAVKDNPSYITTLFSLADSYRRVGIHDSASFYNKLGVKESLASENKNELYHFILNEGINKYDMGLIEIASDSVSKVITSYKKDIDNPNLIVAYYYYGKILSKNKVPVKAIQYFKKVDSLFTITQDIIPEARESYEYLINYYKKTGDSENQLRYVKRLLKVDSVLNDNYRYLSKKIAQEYDTPRLLKEKESIIADLKDENKFFSNGIFLTSIFLSISIIGLIYYYKRQKTIKKRFDDLINSSSQELSDTPKPISKPKSKSKTKSLDISDTIVESILNNLKDFENAANYLKPNITVGSLAKQFGTNSKYLSKVINDFKNKNFSVYINDLRIQYVIQKLKEDRKFRMYTIKAISSEIGFNTTEAFSKAFHKKTGIYPSYFIKNLDKLSD
ncbi:helix-turn-helix domain-containing protein [Aquimarina sp. W85]|uniref:helix-turn-helix domain-containing protein n=1 Tax=Aquimarina rhodophyticola TaxID=3342246 RepID=UPI003670B00A